MALASGSQAGGWITAASTPAASMSASASSAEYGCWRWAARGVPFAQMWMWASTMRTLLGRDAGRLHHAPDALVFGTDEARELRRRRRLRLGALVQHLLAHFRRGHYRD